MALLFVFVTIASPLHALAQPTEAMHMMHAQISTKACAEHQAHPEKANTSKDCCHDGCSCPLSHCPGTLAVLPVSAIQLPGFTRMALHVAPNAAWPCSPSDTLKRPPRLTV
ncbi:MAG: hypothetical protein ACTHLA_13040 [Asticcacaulis sp.]|uniref:hypothetical protein n=1 Tax=Asticcacaulis sp. TaxID=1872648 RepID=UPI003F7BFDEA